MAKYVKLCTNPQHRDKGPQGSVCPACLAQKARLAGEQWKERAQTEHTVLLQRIKNAFYEGWCEANTERPDEEIHYYWEHSEAKRVYDTLKDLWSTQ